MSLKDQPTSLKDVIGLSQTMYLALKVIEVSPKEAHLQVFESFGVFGKTPKTSKTRPGFC